MNQRKGKKGLPAIVVVLIMAIVVFLGGGGLHPGNPGAANQPTATAAVSGVREWSDPIIDPYEIADYLFEYGELPENFITKAEAKKLGWDSSRNYLSDVAPGKSIGGDHYGNYEGGLPEASGRKWYECDANYVSGKRGAHRILYSSDGLVYYSSDHYTTFKEIREGD